MAFAPRSEDAHAGNGASNHTLATAERRLRLIVVEDDALIAMELAQTIEAAGGELIGTAATADDAALLAAERDVDVAVIDLHLKGRGDGLHAAQAIRKRSSAAVCSSPAVPAPRPSRGCTHSTAVHRCSSPCAMASYLKPSCVRSPPMRIEKLQSVETGARIHEGFSSDLRSDACSAPSACNSPSLRGVGRNRV
jgi:response regulator receiver domain-containing protein